MGRPDAASPTLARLVLILLLLPARVGAGGSPVTAPVSRAGVPGARAQSAGDDLEVYLVTVQAGDAIWEKFGHNALRIVDRARGTDVSWNWGVFSFEQEGFIVRFIRGTMLYSMAGWPTDATLESYRAANRTVWMQELALTPAQKRELQRAVHVNYLPSNREYRYDYFRDNCSTRIRDHLDAVLGGALGRALRGEATGTTYRWHTRRLLAAERLAYAGIQFGLGERTDVPLDAWDESFLPLRLREHVRGVEVTGADGERVPLVEREFVAVPSDRPPEPAGPPDRLGVFLVLGLAWAALVALTGTRAAGGRRLARAAFVAVAGAWCLVAAVAGLVLVGAWAFTDHVFWARNENVVQGDPLMAVVGIGLLVLLARGRVPRWAVLGGLVVAALSVLGFVAQVLPGVDQSNGEIIAMALPVNLAVAWGLLVQRDGTRSR